jgi:hypothetical protein
MATRTKRSNISKHLKQPEERALVYIYNRFPEVVAEEFGR